ncbi:hypothetical protein GA0115240_13001, partial [Streptomyces sp. DvalAA-14]|uniref:AAWKG family protein n=1 Tax=unclassified Streptomyces TaxID=2593676 RepID=UPI00081BA5C6
MAADNWEHIINLMTGFTLAERSAIEGSKGAGGIPWLDVEIKSVGMSLHAESTAHGDGMGFDIQFYSGTGTDVGKYQATVTFKDQTDGRQYWKRSAAALADLVASPYKTAGVTSGTDVGGDPTPDAGVDLTSFSTLAKSFDKAGVFFTNHAETLKQWAESLGDENAAWKGQAAGVFWHLINDLHDKYDNYTSELIPPGFSPANTSVSTGYVSTTKHGDSVIGAEVALHTALQSMNDSLSKYMNQTGTPISVTHPDGSSTSDIVSGDTREVLYKVMTEITDWVSVHNAPGVVGYMAPNPYGGYMGNPTAPIQSYTTNANYSDATTWGNLKDTSTWSGAANEAVKRWQTNIETNLDTPARADVTTLQQSWSRVLDPNWDTTFAFEDTDTTSLAQDLQQEKADIQQDKANDEQNNLNNSLNGLGDNLNGLGNNLNGLGNNLNGLGDNLNNFGDGLNNGLNGFGDSLNNGLNGLGDNLNNFSTGLDNGLNGFGDSISNGLGGLNGLGGPGGGGPLTGLNGDSSLLTPNGPLPTPGSGDFFTNPGPGATGVRNADGSVTTQNADGSVTTQFPDGSSTTVNPDGTITTHNADGTTTTSQLGPGQTLTNPDGSTTTVSGNGEITTHFPDGSTVTQNADGSLTTTNADGSTSTHFPNGTVE